jgi:mono/diheme cytochrome c family protein
MELGFVRERKMSKKRSSTLRRTLTFALTSGVVALIPALSHAQEPKSVDAGMAAMGKSAYRTYCAACHGLEGKGDGPLANDLKVHPADLTRVSAENGGVFPFDTVYQIIDGRKKVRGHGTEEMPAWGDAFKTTDNEEQTEKRIRQLTHYIWSIQVK